MKVVKALAVCLLFCVDLHAEEPIVVAHRGASRDAPENTLSAFRLAWEQGADAIEGDFHLSKDGEIVCIHDRNTKKVADKNLVVRDSTLAELKKLDVGRYRGENFRGVKIPTLAEVFATVPQRKKIYIEVKCGAEIIPRLLEEIRKSDLEKEQIIVISFQQLVIREFKAKAPQYQAYWLSGLKKDQSGNIKPSVREVLATLEKTKADGFSASKSIVDEELIKQVQANGYEYHVWTIDDIRLARRFGELGVGSITTNVPGSMKRQLTGEDGNEVGR